MKPWILLLLAGLLVLSSEQASAKTKRHIVKPGECPMFKIPADYPCDIKCSWDSDCEDNKKCCPIGCARKCFAPGPV